jgi:LSD1 subclass zinc finger protein
MNNIETNLQSEFPCLQCGATLKYVPGSTVIKCEYCNHEQPINSNTNSVEVQEYDFEKAINNKKSIKSSSLINDSKEVQCSGCGAISLIKEQSTRCPFCGSAIVLDISESFDRIAPESLLPFKIEKREAQKSFINWLRSRWFAPNDLIKRAQTDGMDGVYLPFWTYDSNTSTKYTGERGEFYYTTESYTDSSGRTQTRSVQHTRWYHVSGNVNVNFDDILVCASESLPHSIIDNLESWELNELLPYSPEFLSGFITERYKIDLKSGFEIAKEKMNSEIVKSIHTDIGGDTQRLHSKSTKYIDIKFKHILLPIWISSFKYKEKIYRIVINARNGEVSGERPYSWIKITFAILSSILLLSCIYYFSNL